MENIENNQHPPPPPFSMRFTREERAFLDNVSAGMSLSAYIRERLFDENIKPRKTRNKFPVKDHKLLSQLLGQLGSLALPATSIK